MTESFTEIRQRITKPDQVFPCQVFLRREGYLLLRYVNEEVSEAAGTVIPAGSITLAHYVQAASSVWWEMYYPAGSHLADLIHFTSPVQIRAAEVEYTELLLDIWRPGRRSATHPRRGQTARCRGRRLPRCTNRRDRAARCPRDYHGSPGPRTAALAQTGLRSDFSH